MLPVGYRHTALSITMVAPPFPGFALCTLLLPSAKAICVWWGGMKVPRFFSKCPQFFRLSDSFMYSIFLGKLKCNSPFYLAF